MKTKTITRKIEREAGTSEPEESILDDLVAAQTPRVEPPRAESPRSVEAPLVGECVDARHPTLQGRIRVRWEDPAGATEEQWLPTLQGLVARVADRVLIGQPANFDEPVVMGVLDGFAERPAPEALRGPVLAVEKDEALHVTSSDGEALLEIRQEQSGPVVRIVKENLDLELPGKLRLSAEAIELEARRGPVKIGATSDVVVEGEAIKLN